jgi:hypothetical protein
MLKAGIIIKFRMKEEEVKTIILEIFNKTRQSSVTDYDEAHFMDYLIHPPSARDSIKGSFKGVRKYYNFFSAVELRFGICFSLSDQDKIYSIDKFVLKTKERIESSRGNKMIIRQRIAEKNHYYIEFILTMILVTIIWFFKIHVVSVIGTIFYATGMWWILGSKIRNKRHDKELYKVIMGKEKE